MRRYAVVCAIGFVAGCPDRSISKVTTVENGAITKSIPVEANLDVLFVIDNSQSTSDKQLVFAQNFMNFVAALDNFEGGRPNLHIGVVSSTVGLGVQTSLSPACPMTAPNDDGLLQHTARVTGCTPPNGNYLSDILEAGSNARTVNYTGTLDEALSCIAELGSDGCGFEAQLEGMKRALDGSRPENMGFLRPNAYLAVIFLTDEDDCSVRDPTIFTLDVADVGPDDFRCQPLYAYNCDQQISPDGPGTYTNCTTRTDSYLQTPAFYYDFLSSVKDPSQIVVAMIAGDPISSMTTTGAISMPFAQPLALEPSCMATINTHMAIGRPGIRLADFTSQFADRGLFQSVCQSDYSGAVSQIGALLFNAINPCLEGPIDLTDADPNNPGLQPQCTVSDVQDATGSNSEQSIEPCVMTDPVTPDPTGARPCWWVKSNPISCTTDTGLELHIERTSPPASDTTVEVSCSVTPM